MSFKHLQFHPWKYINLFLSYDRGYKTKYGTQDRSISKIHQYISAKKHKTTGVAALYFKYLDIQIFIFFQ